jgi:hypothetical protein
MRRDGASVVAVCVALGAGVALPASAEAAWSAPVSIASSNLWSFHRPELAVNAAGDGALALWLGPEAGESSQRVEAATRSAGSPWSSATLLSPPHDTEDAWAPRIAIDARGDIVAAWEHDHTFDAASHPAAGKWQAPVALTRAGETPTATEAPALALAENGDASVVFVAERHGRTRLELSLRGRKGVWSRPRTLATGDLEQPQVAVDVRGETVIAWLAGGGVQVVILRSGGVPEGPVRDLAPPSSCSFLPGCDEALHLALNADGDAVLVWRLGLVQGSLEAATRAPGGGFSKPMTISRAEDEENTVAIEPGGAAAILFTRLLSTQEANVEGHDRLTQRSVVEVASRSARGRWRKPRPLHDASPESTYQPQLASGPGGELVAVWTRARSNDEQGSIEAATRGAGGGWRVVGSLGSGEDPSIAAGADGDATAAWTTRPKTPAVTTATELITPALTESAVELAEYQPPHP